MKQILYAGGVFWLCGHCAVEGSVLNVITCVYACAPPFPGGEPRCGTQCGCKEPGKYMKFFFFEHTERVPVSLWYSLCYPVLPRYVGYSLDDQLVNLLLFVATNFNRC